MYTDPSGYDQQLILHPAVMRMIEEALKRAHSFVSEDSRRSGGGGISFGGWRNYYRTHNGWANILIPKWSLKNWLSYPTFRFSNNRNGDNASDSPSPTWHGGNTMADFAPVNPGGLTAGPGGGSGGEPRPVNFNGTGDEVLKGITSWATFLNDRSNSFSARKTSYGKHYSLDDIFYNIPSPSSGGYGPTGDVKTQWYRTSKGNAFSIAIQRTSNTNILQINKSINFSSGNGTELNIYFNGMKNGKGGRDQVITLKLPNESFYKPIGIQIFGSDFPF